MSPLTLIGIKCAVVLALFAGLYGYGHHNGVKATRALWDADKVKVAAQSEAAILAAQERYVRIQKFNEVTARKASEAHEKAISDLQAQYDAARAAIRAAGGLRISRAICTSQDHGATTTAGAGRSDDPAATTVALPDETERRLLELSREADALAERLRALQMWIKGAGLYGPGDELPAAPGAK